MKKIVCIMMVLVLCVSFVGCNKEADELANALSLIEAKSYNEAELAMANVKDETKIAEFENKLDEAHFNDAKDLLSPVKFDNFDKAVEKINNVDKKNELISKKIAMLNELQRTFLYNSIGVIEEENFETNYESYHIAALTKDGTVLVSNLNNTKIKGDSTGRESYKRYDGTNGIRVTQERALSYVKDWKNVSSIACNDSYILGLTNEGKGLTAGTSLDGANAIDPFMGSQSNWYNQVHNHNKVIASIVAGPSYSLAVTTDNSVLTCGWETPFTAGIKKYPLPFEAVSAFEWNDIISVAAGIDYTIGLKKDGTLTAVGSNFTGSCNVDKWNNIINVVAGNGFTVGLKSDGTVVTAGYMDNEGDIDISSWTGVKRLYAGFKTIVGIKSDGTLLILGDFKGKEEAEKWTDIKEVALQSGDDLVGLKNDGTLITLLKNQSEINTWSNLGK